LGGSAPPLEIAIEAQQLLRYDLQQSRSRTRLIVNHARASIAASGGTIMFDLLTHIGTDDQSQITFTVLPADLKAAIASGFVISTDPLNKQIRDAAVCKAVQLGARGEDHAWALVEGDQTIVMNEPALQFVRDFLA
jgi:hypothetical protein